MKKELLMILLILGLPTVFIMNLGSEKTGAIANEMGLMRLERINLALSFPEVADGPYKVTIDRIRKYLREGAYYEYYYPQGLTKGYFFFPNEMLLYTELLKLMCLKQTEEGKFISPGGVIITLPGGKWQGVEFRDAGMCDSFLQQAAERTLLGVTELDFRLVETTAGISYCGFRAVESMQLAMQNKNNRNYEAMLNNLQEAWTESQCG